MQRRRFLKTTIQVGGGIIAGAVAIPVAITLISPAFQTTSEPSWTRVGELESFPIDSTKGAIIEVARNDWAQSMRTKLLYVRRDGSGEFKVFSRNCTDLSCPIAWDPGSGVFVCPCHGGIFDREGRPMAGPPKRPLYRYRHREVDGMLEVDVNSVPPLT